MICGTADQVSYSGDLVIVSDLKAGKWRVDAKDNRQLQGLVAMASCADKRRRVNRAIGAIIQAPYDSTDASQVRSDPVEYDSIEIAGFRHDLRELKRRIEEQRPDPVPVRYDNGSDDHCRFCPARPGCNEHEER